MMTATPPGIETRPRPATRDFFDRLPRRARGLTKAEEAVYFEVVDHLDEDGYYCRTNRAGGQATGMKPSNFGVLIARLGRVHPRGLDHPYWEITGATRRRRVRPLLLPKGAPHEQPAIRMRRHSNPGPIRMPAHSNPTSQQPESRGVAASGPRLGPKTNPNENDSSLSFSGSASHAHVHARASPPPEPVASPPPAEALPSVAAQPAPAAGPVPPARPSMRTRAGRAITTAEVMARLQALQERPAAEEVRSPGPAPADGASEPLTPEIAAAREMSGAKPDAPPTPKPTPGPYSQGTPRPKSPVTPRLLALVQALYATAGAADAVGELVRHVGWLFDSTKPETVKCWTQGFGEAVTWLGREELLEIIGAAGSPRVEPFRRCRYLSTALCDRLLKAKRDGAFHRRE